MTPTTAIIAVAFAAELLPAPIAAHVIHRITNHVEASWSAAVEKAARLAAERDAVPMNYGAVTIGPDMRLVEAQMNYAAAQYAAEAPMREALAKAQARMEKHAGYDSIKRRRPIPFYDFDQSPERIRQRRMNAEAAAYAAEEARLAAEFEAIARADPHMKQG